MPAAPLPTDELERQQLLESLRILDTPPEPVFDRVTRLASRLLGVPIALFTLVEGDRQWFKSRIGINVQETPREQAFCAHTILQSGPLVVPDTTVDPRFMDNAFVNGRPDIRFYAGIPIRSRDGYALGTLCVIDTKPRRLSEGQMQTMHDLADIITQEIEYREQLASARDRAEQSIDTITRSETRFRSVFDLASIGMAMVAPDGGWLSVNSALCQIVGYSQDELRRLTFRDITYPPDLGTELALLRQLQAGEINQFQLEKRYVRKDGATVWINLNVTKEIGPAGELRYYIAAIKDIQAQKEAAAALQALHADLEARVEVRTRELHDTIAQLKTALFEQEQAKQQVKDREAELHIVIENANDAYISLDHTGKVRDWNRQAELTFGWSAAEAIGQSLDQLIVPEELRDRHHRGMSRYVATGESTVEGKRLELPGLRKDGSRLTVEVRIAALEVKGNRIFSAFLHDISDRKKAEGQREYERRHDVLTGLLNRRALTEMLPIAQGRAQQNGTTLGVLFIDLDGFKMVNDQLGHEAGDHLLRHIADRLQKTIQQTGNVFRFAGDEFTVLLENINAGGNDAYTVAGKLIEQIAMPVDVCGTTAAVGASIGIALFSPTSTVTAAGLIREADHWMYEAKKAGRGKVWPRRT